MTTGLQSKLKLQQQSQQQQSDDGEYPDDEGKDTVDLQQGSAQEGSDDAFSLLIGLWNIENPQFKQNELKKRPTQKDLLRLSEEKITYIHDWLMEYRPDIFMCQEAPVEDKKHSDQGQYAMFYSLLITSFKNPFLPYDFIVVIPPVQQHEQQQQQKQKPQQLNSLMILYDINRWYLVSTNHEAVDTNFHTSTTISKDGTFNKAVRIYRSDLLVGLFRSKIDPSKFLIIVNVHLTRIKNSDQQQDKKKYNKKIQSKIKEYIEFFKKMINDIGFQSKNNIISPLYYSVVIAGDFNRELGQRGIDLRSACKSLGVPSFNSLSISGIDHMVLLSKYSSTSKMQTRLELSQEVKNAIKNDDENKISDHIPEIIHMTGHYLPLSLKVPSFDLTIGSYEIFILEACLKYCLLRHVVDPQELFLEQFQDKNGVYLTVLSKGINPFSKQAISWLADKILQFNSQYLQSY